MNDFRIYDHIERLGNEEVEGIELGTVHVFPKLDGTNARVSLRDDKLVVGSRRREIDPLDDNHGFASWVATQGDNPLRLLFSVLRGCGHQDAVVYGEWLVPHTLLTYRDDAWRKFWIFDVWVPNNGYLNYDFLIREAEQNGLNFVPPLCIITNPSEEQLIKNVESNTFLIKDGMGVGEGIVLKNFSWRNKYGRQPWAKLVRNEFKERNRATFGTQELKGQKMVEQDIAWATVTPTLVGKERAKIEQETTDRAHLIPRLLQTVYHSVVTEELWDQLKKHKMPTVDFKRLNQFVIQVTKTHAQDLF